MNGFRLGQAVADRLTALMPEMTIYWSGVPDGELPAQYIVVWSAEGYDTATRACSATSIQTPIVWVTATSRRQDGMVAGREASLTASKVRQHLRDWRPDGEWKLRPESSTPATRDETLPETVYFAVERFSLRSRA